MSNPIDFSALLDDVRRCSEHYANAGYAMGRGDAPAGADSAPRKELDQALANLREALGLSPLRLDVDAFDRSV